MALNHTAKGPVDYTIVGNPTIVDGVMTYSNVSNYVRTRQNLLSSYNDYEIVCKCAKRLSTEEIVYCMSTGNNGNLQARLLSNAFRFIPYTFSNYIEIRGTFATDVWYWFKVRRTGNTIYASYSTDGVSWSNEVSKTFTQLTTSSNWIAFGTRVVSDSSWNGTSIDFNETYITVNGQPWFGVCPVEVKKHQLIGPVGYTVVGSPTIADGIASGFSSSDYLTTPIFNPSNSRWEIVCKFTTTTLNNQDMGIITGIGTVDNVAPLFVNSKNFLTFFISSNGTSWDVANLQGIIPLSPNTTYKIKIEFTGSAYNAYSLENEQFVLKSTVSSSSICSGVSGFAIGNNRGTARGFNGSINLNETYIKVNGKLWFYQPAPTKYIVKDGELVWADPRIALSGHVNYTAVGNPTIVDGVANGFSASDYLQCNSIDLNNNFELNVAFNKTESSGGGILTGYTTGGLNNVAGKVRFYAKLSDNTDYILGTTGSISQNTNYVANVKRTGNSITLMLYENGVNKETITDDLTGKTFSSIGTAFYIGYSNSYGYLRGSIDLKETYIKVNDQLWFYGKNYATQNIAPVPSGFTFGTTTTPSIGYVDMRTQEFTSAPQGATIGRGEPPQPVNNSYTVQGNPTISGDIISGFSANDYLKANFSSPTPERGQIQSFEMVLDFTTGDTISASNERIVGLSASTSYFPTVQFKDDSAPHLVCIIFGRGSYGYEWVGGNNMATYGSPLVPNTHYTARVWWSKYNPDWSTDVNIANHCQTQIKNPTTGEWEKSGSFSGIYDIDITDTTFLIGTSYSGTRVFNGSIDISKCYVKIDGEMWWDGSGGR